MGKLIDLSKNGARKTDLLYKGNLSYSQLQDYLTFLIERNIIEEKTVEDNGSTGKYYCTTEKGFEFLRDAKKVLAHLNL
jgi:predicted transcriptional regulator